MRPTTPQRLSASAEPSPNLREHARIQASTARACLRKLSDWVNSVSKQYADSRFIISSPGFVDLKFDSRNAKAGAALFVHFILDFHKAHAADCPCSRPLPHKSSCFVSCKEGPLWHSHNPMATTLAPVDSREVV